MPSRQIFNPESQAVEDAELTVFDDGEIMATFASGHFLKFPAGLTPTQFENAIATVQTANEGQEPVDLQAELAASKAKRKSEKLIGLE